MRAEAPLALLALALALSLGAPREASAVTAKHPGPMGIAWGTAPKQVKKLLKGRFTFALQKPGEKGTYDTIEQRFSGAFGGLETESLRLIFHKNGFFYLAVTLKTEGKPGAAIEAFHAVVRKMTKAYGPPDHATPRPPRLSSKTAILENVELEANRGWVLPMLLNEQSREDVQRLYELEEWQLRTDMWDPFAAWRFANGVTVQTFVYRFRPDDAPKEAQPVLVPIWIFSKDDRFEAWRKAKPTVPRHFVPPRDY